MPPRHVPRHFWQHEEGPEDGDKVVGPERWRAAAGRVDVAQVRAERYQGVPARAQLLQVQHRQAVQGTQARGALHRRLEVPGCLQHRRAHPAPLIRNIVTRNPRVVVNPGPPPPPVIYSVVMLA